MAFVRPIVSSNPATNAPVPVRTRRRRRVIILLVASAAIFFVLLRFSGWILVSESRVTTAEFVIVGDWWCDRCITVASERMKSEALEGVLLFSPEDERLVMLGVIAPADELCRKRLIEDGVAPDAIQIIDGTSHSSWQSARLIDAWLQKHPDKRVNLLCERFSSRRWSYIVDHRLAESNRSRLTIQAVADSRFDETNWWRNRSGIKSFFHNVFRFGYARLRGEDPMPNIDWSPEKYEASILK